MPGTPKDPKPSGKNTPLPDRSGSSDWKKSVVNK